MATRGSKKKSDDGVDKMMVTLDPIPTSDTGELMLRTQDVREILDIIESEDDAKAYSEAAKNLKAKMAERLGSEAAFVSALVRNARKIQKDPDALKEQVILISATEQFAVMEDGVQALRRIDKQNEAIRAENANKKQESDAAEKVATSE